MITIKTADSLIIELNNQRKKLLNKYKDMNLEEDKALLVILNQRMNDYLKELDEMAGINEIIRKPTTKVTKELTK